MKPPYRRMLQKLQENLDPAAEASWAVYIALCADGSLYTGIAKDVAARLAKHNAGQGAAYTRTRRPVQLIHHETGLTRSQALIREAKIKALPRAKKLELISG